MPILPNYTAQIGGGNISGGRRAGGEDLYGGVDGAGKALVQAATSYVDRAEEDETRRAIVASAEIRAKYARALDEAALSGADLPKLKEQMTTELAKVGEDFQTKKGQDHIALYTSNAELMYDEQANRINVQRAFSAAKLGGQKLINAASATIQSNPLYLPRAEQDVDDFVKTFRIGPERQAELADKLKKDLNMAAAIATARVNPKETIRRLESGEWNLEPEQRAHAIDKANSELRSQRAEDAYLRAEEERVRREEDETARDKHFKSIMAGDKGVRRAIMDDPTLRPASREHLIVFMEQRAKAMVGGDRKSDPSVVRDLWLRIHAPDNDPRKIYNGDAVFEQVSRGNVNTTDANMLMQLVAGQKDENNRSIGQRLSAMSSTVNRALSQDPQFTAQPALVAEIQNDYHARVLDKVKRLREEKKDPAEVFNPQSKEYVGSRAFIQESIDTAKARQRAAAPQVPTVSTQAEYDALPPGAAYIDSKGNRAVKGPGKKASPGKGPTASGLIRTAE